MDHPMLREAFEARSQRLKRYRVDAGLTQDEVAAKLAVSQQAVGKWERDGTASEEVLGKLWKLYDIRDHYPAAPKDPERRREWFEGRNERLRHYSPGVKTIGAGKVD